MPTVNFQSYAYVADLLSTPSELDGYRRLSDADKDALLPVFGISWFAFNISMQQTQQRIRDAVGQRPFLLDLDHRPAPTPYEAGYPADPEEQERRLAWQVPAQEAYNEELSRLLVADDGYANWRTACAAFPSAVPLLQFRDPPSATPALLRQASRLSAGGQSIAIRARGSELEGLLSVLPQLIAVLDSPDRLLLVVDIGQGRQTVSERTQQAVDFMSSLTASLEPSDASRVVAALVSNSFTTSNHDGMRDYQSLDWRIWRRARESFPFIHGDYGATPRAGAHAAFVPPDWRPTVVYPLAESWLFYRGANLNDSNGWIEGSSQVTNHDAYGQPLNVWGAEKVRTAALGDLSDVASPRHWRAIKVNIHLYRQISYSREQLIGDVAEEG